MDFLRIHPLTFKEFLLANGDENLLEYLDAVGRIEPIPEAFFNPLTEKMKMYFVTGGMPEPVLMWTKDRDVDGMQAVLGNLLGAYERDFAKHAEKKEYPKITRVWQSLPSQLSRENKKFLYQIVKEGARAREYEDAIDWLVHADLVKKIYRSKSPGVPMSAYDDLTSFKLYVVDVGLLRRLALLAPSAFREGTRLFTEFKGALSENYILQALVPQFEATPRYWSMDNPRYEVDFIIQHENEIIPVEVKSSEHIASKSLQKYKEKFAEKVKTRLRFSTKNLKMDGDVINIPLFMADYTSKILSLRKD